MNRSNLVEKEKVVNECVFALKKLPLEEIEMFTLMVKGAVIVSENKQTEKAS